MSHQERGFVADVKRELGLPEKGDTVRVPAGQGYWDVTHYPYGGCFRRAMCEWTGVVVEVSVGRHGRETKVLSTGAGHLPGGYCVVQTDALTVVSRKLA